VEFSGDVALEAAGDLAVGLAVFGAAFDVGAGGGVAVAADERDGPERVVGAAVAASVETVPLDLAAGCFDGAGAAEGGERSFGSDACGVVAGGDEELRCGLGPDTGASQESGCCLSEERSEVLVELGDLGAEVLPSAREVTQRSLGGLDGFGPGAGSHSGASLDPLLRGEWLQLG
jgi:hypothetical protein